MFNPTPSIPELIKQAMDALKTAGYIYDSTMFAYVHPTDTTAPVVYDTEVYNNPILVKVNAYALTDKYDDILGVDFWPSDTKDKSCTHDWKIYTGLQETFLHCVKCGEKKP